MKSLYLFFILVSSSSFALAANENALPEPRYIKVSDEVHVLLGPKELPNKHNRGYMVNSTFIIGDKGVILIDTGFSHAIGQHIKKQIAKVTDKPVTHVINTHHHGDHTLGNIAFKDATIISSENCKARVEKTGYEWIGILESMTGAKFPDTKPVSASKVYPQNTRQEITLQGVKLVLWLPHHSHTNNDLIVMFPEEQLLVGGDILVHEVTPGFRDTNVLNLIATLDEIGKTKMKTIVPGHGPLMTTQDVKNYHAMVNELYQVVEAGYKKGLMDSDIRKTLDLTRWKNLADFEAQMGTVINRTYLEVEERNF